MRGGAALLLALALVPACGDVVPIVGPAPSVRAVVSDGEVELGRAFPLTVVRVWRNGAEEPAWSDDRLSPLVVRRVEIERRASGSFVEETRRYRAYAFALGRLTLPALSDLDAPVRLKVRPALDPREPGQVELPVGLLDEPVRWPIFLGAGLAALLTLVVIVRVRRRPPEPEPSAEPAPEPPDPREVALAALALLGEREPGTPEETQAFYRSDVRARTVEGLTCFPMTNRTEALAQDEASFTVNGATRFQKATAVQNGNEVSTTIGFTLGAQAGTSKDGASANVSASMGVSVTTNHKDGDDTDALNAFGSHSVPTPTTALLQSQGKSKVHVHRRVHGMANVHTDHWLMYYVGTSTCPGAGPVAYGRVYGHKGTQWTGDKQAANDFFTTRGVGASFPIP